MRIEVGGILSCRRSLYSDVIANYSPNRRSAISSRPKLESQAEAEFVN